MNPRTGMSPLIVWNTDGTCGETHRDGSFVLTIPIEADIVVQ